MSGFVDRIASWIGVHLGRYLSQASHVHGTAAPTDPIKLMACLRPGDVLLIEGQTRVSVAINWSHAALYAGNATGLNDPKGLPQCFLRDRPKS
jgi:hypothetical protein